MKRIALFGIILLLGLVLLQGCQKEKVEVTITYDRNAVAAFPYTAYGDVATIYYTIGMETFTKTVRNHQSIKVVLTEGTELRAMFEKIINDNNGTTKTNVNEFYKVNVKQPVWKF